MRSFHKYLLIKLETNENLTRRSTFYWLKKEDTTNPLIDEDNYKYISQILVGEKKAMK